MFFKKVLASICCFYLIFPCFIRCKEWEKITQFETLQKRILDKIECYKNDKDNILVIWDVDGVLVVSKSAIFYYNDLYVNVFCKRLLNIDREKKTKLKSIVYQKDPERPVNSNIPAFIQTLQKQGIKNIALTATPPGKYGEIESFEDLRIESLKKNGFDFRNSFPNIPFIQLQEDPSIIFKDCAVLSGKCKKGWAQQLLLSSLYRDINWVPKLIIFIDDQSTNLDSIQESCKHLLRDDHPIDCLCLHFCIKPENLPPPDSALAEFQVTWLLSHQEWLPDEQARKKINSPCACLCSYL